MSEEKTIRSTLIINELEIEKYLETIKVVQNDILLSLTKKNKTHYIIFNIAISKQPNKYKLVLTYFDGKHNFDFSTEENKLNNVTEYIQNEYNKLFVCDKCHKLSYYEISNCPEICLECVGNLCISSDVDHECAICKENIVGQAKITECFHVFHRECFRKLGNCPKCPICRKRLTNYVLNILPANEIYPNDRNPYSANQEIEEVMFEDIRQN